MPNIPRVERLAKRLCKALATVDQPSGSVIASFKTGSIDRDLPLALELAVARQWLQVRDGSYALTRSGELVGVRSRSGVLHKRRVITSR
jgi:hypothetical protein